MITYRDLSRFLGCSIGTVAHRVKLGMPRHDSQAAAAWCVRLPARKKYERDEPPARRAGPHGLNGNGTARIEVDTAGVDLAGETLKSTISRLRTIEKLTSDALARSTAKDPAGYETAILRRAHLDAVRTMYQFEAKLIKHNEARAKLIAVDRVRALILGSIEGGVEVLRRPPDLARDEAERHRFEEFAAAVIAEFENGK